MEPWIGNTPEESEVGLSTLNDWIALLKMPSMAQADVNMEIIFG